MFDRLYRLLTGGGGLLRAEAQLASLALRRVLAAAVAMAVACVLAAIALVTLAVAGVVMLAAEVGWAPAAAIVGGIVLLLSLGVLLAARLGLPRSAPVSPAQAQREAERCKAEMRDAVTPDPQVEDRPRRSGAPHSAAQWQQAATEFVSKHPLEVATGAFAVLALVGPFRTLRLVGRGATIAGLVGTLLQRTQHGPEDPAVNATRVNGTGRTGESYTAAGPGPATGGI